ncbi:MAG: nucleoside hydrolase, partial [Thermoleophilaceae bacterium]|nr:nucleoside hydrolase [Thermoleophilaceae bacterium]
PGAAARIGRIALMGGAVAEGNVTPAAEFNIWCDPEAARRVFESGLDVTMVGLDVTHAARVNPSHHEALRAAGPAGALVVELLEFYGGFHKRIYGWDGSPIHDALTLAHVIAPGLLRTERLHVAVETESQLCRGRTVVDRWRRTGLAPNASVAIEVPDPEAFPQLLIDRLGRL